MEAVAMSSGTSGPRPGLLQGSQSHSRTATVMHQARSPVAGHSDSFMRTLKVHTCKTRIVCRNSSFHSSIRGVLWHSSRGAHVCGESSDWVTARGLAVLSFQLYTRLTLSLALFSICRY